MPEVFKRFESRISEEDCLDEMMRLRFGGAPCQACEGVSGFKRLARHRAFSCRSCGFQVYPCLGTPFADGRVSLTQWFFTIDLMARASRREAKRLLRQALGRSKPTDRLLAGVEQLRGDRSSGGHGIDWFTAITDFVRVRAETGEPAARVPSGEAGSGRPGAGAPETAWQMLKASLRLPDRQFRPSVGIGIIVTLASMGATIGWLAVPAPPAEDAELTQATAILTLSSDRAIIVVSADVAAQLYDVSDLEAAPDSALASSIRVAASVDGKLRAGGLADARPMERPAIKLAPAIGRELLRGDRSAASGRSQAGPELAAYSSLARELDASGLRNPDELLTFGPMRIRRHLVDKIVRAARATDMDPVLLMAIADKESSFQTEAQAQTSSASGLFQFIERTWLGVVREFGARYGLEKEAQAVAAGELDPAGRTRLLDMRRDAYLSAVLAGEMLKRDSDRIARRLGRVLTGGEVYLVHFLGPDGAERLLDQVRKSPEAVAADLLPRPAAANKPIFYGSAGDGTAKGLSVSEVHTKFESMMSLRLERYSTVRVAPATGRPSR